MDDLREPLKSCCKKLRLSANLAERAMTVTGDTHPEYLYNLFTKEIEYRHRARIEKLLNSAGFPKRYGVEQFKTDEIDFPEDVTVVSQILCKLQTEV